MDKTMFKSDNQPNWDNLRLLADSLNVEIFTTYDGVYWVTYPTNQVKFFDSFIETWEYLQTLNNLPF